MRGTLVSVLTGAALLLAAAPAAAVPDCPSLPKQHEIASGQGRLESIIGDARGRLYFTDLTENRLLRLDGPGQQPKVLATEMKRPGGLLWEPIGTLAAGFSGGAASGVPGNGMAGLFRVNPETGAKQEFVTGIDQANGLARGPDGSLYTSNNIAGEIVRVPPKGSVQRNWATVDSPNGLVVDRAGKNLYAAQTFTPAKIARIPLANPGAAETAFAAPPDDTAAGLDGLERDGADRLYAAANGAGEVWRVTPAGAACALVRGLSLPSSLAFGGGGSFPRGNLYVVTFSGSVIELARTTDRPPPVPKGSPGEPKPAKRPKLRLAVNPHRTRAGKLTRFRFKVRSRGRPVAGATVRLGGKRATTGPRGRASIERRFAKRGKRRARATRRGYRPGGVTITVRKAR